jgi:hypothetical protein
MTQTDNQPHFSWQRSRLRPVVQFSRSHGWKIARWVVFTYIAACLLAFAAGVFLYPAYAVDHRDSFRVFGWNPEEIDYILARVGLSFDWLLNFRLVDAVLLTAIQAGLGLLIWWKQKNDWFSLFVALGLVQLAVFGGYTWDALAYAYPLLEPITTPLRGAAWYWFFLIFYFFPDGRIIPRWMTAFVAAMIIGWTLSVFGSSQSPPHPALIAFTVGAVGAAAANQVYRYWRVSTPLQRQQTKWVLFAFLAVFVSLVCTTIPMMSAEPVDPDSTLALFLLLLSTASVFIMGLIPVSIAIAILRYRLWEIDLLIRRTLIYSAFTAVLGLLYWGTVTVLQNLFTAASGQSSPVAIVLSTLIIAALFNTLRYRIQAFIDRRFYRQKYNAEQALAGFSALARSETDLDVLASQLVRVVQETMQPNQVSVWLGGGHRSQKVTYEP